MSLVRRYGDTDFVTALRAIAALLVVVDHTDAFDAYGQIGANITLAAKHGVEMFFVISGFTIATTFLRAPGYRHYLTRRIFRIAPPYYLAVITGFLLASSGVMQPMWLLDALGGALDLRNLTLHLVFLSDLDWRIADSILGVEWTIPVEVFWYILLPAVIPRLQTPRGFALYTLVFIGIDIATRLASLAFLPVGHIIFVDTFVAKYAYYFLLGIAAYQIRQRQKTFPAAGVRLLVLLAPVAIVSGLIAANYGSGALTGLGTFLMIAFYKRQNHPVLSRLLENRILLYLGSISFSIYLTHNIIVQIWLKWHGDLAISGPLLLLAVLGVVVPLSTAAYTLIEKPSNRLGKQLADRWFDAPEHQKNPENSVTTAA